LAYEPFLKATEKAQAIAKLGYDQLAKLPIVNADKIGAIGFCFGGAMALNLARSGAKLVAAVSLHGEYPHLGNLTGTYNTQHFVEMVGGADPFIPATARAAWVSELQSYTKGSTDKTFDFIVYGTAVHAFSIRYSATFLHVLAAALRHKGLAGAKVVGDGIPGVVRYDADIAAMSFYRIKHLFTKLGLLSKPAMKPKPTMKPKPAATAGKPKPTEPSKPAATTGKPKPAATAGKPKPTGPSKPAATTAKPKPAGTGKPKPTGSSKPATTTAKPKPAGTGKPKPAATAKKPTAGKSKTAGKPGKTTTTTKKA